MKSGDSTILRAFPSLPFCPHGFISAECLYQEDISVEFNFEEEQYIDDINL
jgi:hypothetical protein